MCTSEFGVLIKESYQSPSETQWLSGVYLRYVCVHTASLRGKRWISEIHKPRIRRKHEGLVSCTCVHFKCVICSCYVLSVWGSIFTWRSSAEWNIVLREKVKSKEGNGHPGPWALELILHVKVDHSGFCRTAFHEWRGKWIWEMWSQKRDAAGSLPRGRAGEGKS